MSYSTTQSIAKTKATGKPSVVVKRLKAEFLEKNKILSQYVKGFAVAPLTYFDDLYGDWVLFNEKKQKWDDKLPFTMPDTAKKMRRVQSIEDMLQITVNETAAYYYPCLFFDGYVREDKMRKLCAFVIDLDGISPTDLRVLLKNEIAELRPTYVVNSGHGVHLVYIFIEQIDVYDHRKDVLKEALNALKKEFDAKNYRYKVDDNGIALLHGYRIVGSLTKLGQRTVAFKTGRKWEVAELLKKLNIDPKRLDYKVSKPKQRQSQCNVINFNKKKENSERRKAKHKKLEGKINKTLERLGVGHGWLYTDNGCNIYYTDNPAEYEGYTVIGEIGVTPTEVMAAKLYEKNAERLRRLFYDYLHKRIRKEVTEGHRYTSLFALAIVGKKCKIARKEVEGHISDLVDLFNQHDHMRAVKQNEIAKAMRGYCDKAYRVKSTTIEAYTGLTFEHKKRNGRTQDDHLKIARGNRALKMAVDREAIMRRYLEANPNASLNELVEALNWGKSTVVKYRNLVRNS